MTPVTRALVDSGADVSQFPSAWAPVLGIDLDADCIEGSGSSAGGDTCIYSYEPGIDIIFAGEKVRVKATFNKDLPIILLGRQDLFEAFTISFDERARTFRMESYD